MHLRMLQALLPSIEERLRDGNINGIPLIIVYLMTEQLSVPLGKSCVSSRRYTPPHHPLTKYRRVNIRFDLEQIATKAFSAIFASIS